VLGNASATVSDVAAATAAMRHDGYWQMPVALAKSVPHAIVLGGVGKETPFLGRFNKTIILPRQARDNRTVGKALKTLAFP
jgi:hypothetical protein